jgi:EAL domain-containing protein (putative c-di-GMP-specific phosphodiesterase class I)
MEPGRPLPRDVARYLETRAERGPWIEHEESGRATRPPGRRELVACAPMQGDGETLGILALTASAHSNVGEDASATLSAAIDFATITAGLLAPSLLHHGERHQRRAHLEDVLRRRAFSPVFQPIVELRGARIIGFEALTRFHDGTSPENRFAEASALDRGIELEAATLLAALDAAPSLPRTAWLSVNVSPPLVLAPGILEEAVDAARRPLVLELTEHDRIDDYRLLRRALDRLGDNVRLSVDDAGSGFASLRHVLALQPTFVKLDHTWVSGIHNDPARQALVAGLGHFARSSGCILIAEGVETEPELEVLCELAVDLGQGFLFGHPAPAPDPGYAA